MYIKLYYQVNQLGILLTEIDGKQLHQVRAANLTTDWFMSVHNTELTGVAGGAGTSNPSGRTWVDVCF
jgi:hypothetical protein